jgi:hypothetical protein
MQNNQVEGYLFCCFGDDLYFKLANRLIESIRNFDKVRPICVMTDNMEKLQMFVPSHYEIIMKHFDFAQHLHQKIDPSNAWHRNGLYPKLYQSFYSPFDITMFLDCDVVFYKPFDHLWKRYYDSGKDLVIPGASDENNRSPANWHWFCINEVISKLGINIPQTLSSLMIYNKNLKPKMERHLPFILDNIDIIGCKPYFNNGYPDEIVYSIVMGAEGIRPDTELLTLWCQTENWNSCDKNV